MKKYLWLLCLPLISIAINAPVKCYGEEPINAAEINESMQVILAGDLVDQAFRDFKSAKNIEFGKEQKDGKIYFSAKKPVGVSSSDAQWGKARSLAFEKAMMAIYSQFLVDMYGKQTKDTINKHFSDESSDAEEFEDPEKSTSRLAAIVDKSVALADAKLSKALSEEGVDPSEFNAARPDQKKQIFLEAMINRHLTKAIGNMNGIMPIQTFEGNDDKGNHVIGVIALYSDKLKQISYDIAHKRVPLIKGNGKQLSDVIPKDSGELVDQFGIRCVFDEHGQINLISYGQWSHSAGGNNERKIERLRDRARKMAVEQANGNITTFLAGRMSLEKATESGEIYQELLSKSADGMVTRDEIMTIVDKIQQESRMKASADLAGTNTYGEPWIFRHPNGQESIGVVRVWSPAMLKTAQQVRDWKPNRSNQASGQQTTNTSSQAGLKKGRDITNTNDF